MASSILPNQIIDSQEELATQGLVWKHLSAVIDSLVLKCALDIGIADTIQRHGGSMALSQLGPSLPKPCNNTDALRRVMRYLENMQLVDVEETDDGEEFYRATPATAFLLADDPKSIGPCVGFTLEKTNLEPLFALGSFLQVGGATPTPTTAFEVVHGERVWDFASKHPGYNQVVNEAAGCGVRTLMPAFIDDCREIFEGIMSVVDVGGSTGMAALEAIVAAFPHIKCTLLRRPHAVETVDRCPDVEYVEGDMFSFVPKADAVTLVSVLHDWGDEECVKILKRCKEAIPKDGGKVIIVDIVLGSGGGYELEHARLALDVMMATVAGGKERNEKEWRILLSDAGFSRCNIIPIMAVQSVIVAYP